MEKGKLFFPFAFSLSFSFSLFSSFPPHLLFSPLSPSNEWTLNHPYRTFRNSRFRAYSAISFRV